MMRLVLVALLAVALVGCQWLPAAAAGVAWLGQVLDLAQAGSRAYLERHPSQDAEARVDAAILRARRAAASLGAAVAASDQGRAAKARLEAVAAYSELVALLDGLGVLDGRSPVGGAETDAPRPERLDLPSPESLSAHLP